MKHIFILKKNTSQKLIQDIVSTMQGYEYKLYYTHHLSDVYEICRSFKEKCRFYVVGGDGFVHQAGNALAGSEHELVVLPYGTGNDYARVLYPSDKPIEILKLTLSKQARKVSVMKCNDIYCMNVFALALDGEVGNIVNRSERIRFIPKSMNYGIGILKKIIHLHFYPVCLEGISNQPLTICALCLGTYFGSGIKAGYQSSLQSHFIDINLVEEIEKKELPTYLVALLQGTLHKKKKYRNIQVQKLVVHTENEVNIDGEPYGAGTYIIECIPEALNVVY